MSVISRIDIYSHRNILGGKLWNPAIRWTEKYAIFVVLTDADGQTGIGECWCFDNAPDTLVSYIATEVAPDFVGQNTSDLEAISKRLFSKATLTARHGILASALSGIDLAVWDLRARLSAMPLWKLLNGRGTGCAELYASGGLYGVGKSPADLAKEVSGMVADGFPLVKIKVGAQDIEGDRKRVFAALAALPADGRLIIDGVYTYSVDQALAFYRSLPGERIAAFQSPIAAFDLDGMKYLTGCGVPVMATEAEYRHEIHRYMIENTCVRFLQTAPIACGGVSRICELDALVAGTDVDLSLEVSSTALALMASIHLAAACKKIAHVEHHYVHQVFFDRLQLTAGTNRSQHFSVSDAPGIGFDLPFEKLTHHSTVQCDVVSAHPTKGPQSEVQ